MAQHDLAFPYFSADVPMWDRSQMPAFLRGLASRGRVASRAAGTLQSFGQSMDAFARIIVPADPEVPGDRAAGQGGGGPFFQQMIRLIQKGTVPELGAEVNENDARAVFAELDAHAVADFGRHSFAQLTEPQQRQLVDALLAATLTPLTVSGPNAATVLQSLGRLMVIVVKI